MPTASPAALAPRLPMFLFIAWRNLWRYPVRSLLTILALSGSLIIVILYAALVEGMSRQMVRYATELSISHMQVHRQEFIDNRDVYATLPWSYLAELEARHPAVTMAPRLYAAGLASTEETATGVLIKAIDPDREPRVTKMLAHVQAGAVEWGADISSPDGLPRHPVVVGSRLAKNMGLSPGTELVLVTQAADGSIGNGLFLVTAVLRPVEPGFDRLGVLMSVSAFQELMYLTAGFHELAMHIAEVEQLVPAQQAITQTLAALQQQQPLEPLGGVPMVRTWRQLVPAVAELLELSQSIVFIVGLILISLASLGILNTMLMAVHERMHEFGILLAMGMRRRWLLAMVLLESLMLSLVSVVVGTLLGVWCGSYLENPGIDFRGYLPDGYDWAGIVFEPVMRGWMEPTDIFRAGALLVVVTLLSALIPSWRVVRLRPVEALR